MVAEQSLEHLESEAFLHPLRFSFRKFFFFLDLQTSNWQYALPKRKTVIGQSAFSFKAITEWNKLLAGVKTCTEKKQKNMTLRNQTCQHQSSQGTEGGQWHIPSWLELLGLLWLYYCITMWYVLFSVLFNVLSVFL